MHEMSLCESILHTLEQQAQPNGYCQVTAVWLEIGALAGVEIDAMRFCFDAVMQGSLAENARLEIIAVPGQAWCANCNQTVSVAQRYDDCPQFGYYPVQITDGDQMRIKQLEVA